MSREKQIEEMAKVMCEDCADYGDCKYNVCDAIKDCAKTLYKAGYRKQSENMVELPCNIGDEIWYIDKNYIVQKAEVTCIDIRFSGRYIIATRYVWETEETIKLALMFEHLNIDYWLTKEEAENALAKLKGGAQ